MKFIRTPFEHLVQGDPSATLSLESVSLPHLRQTLKKQRRQLPLILQDAYSWQLCQRLRRQRRLRTAKKIALYFPSQGEVNPLFLQHIFPEKTFFLPSLRQKTPAALHFRPYRHLEKNFSIKNKNLTKNNLKKGAFGIPMPRRGALRRAKHLDVLIVPLLAFDNKYNRLGMGKGFYDRTLAFRRHSPLRRPYLLGMAYPFQQQKTLPAKPWDIPLDAIAALKTRG